ncbi:hypothetical protein LMIY3S_03715 [Labrys miyagiensis]
MIRHLAFAGLLALVLASCANPSGDMSDRDGAFAAGYIRRMP